MQIVLFFHLLGVLGLASGMALEVVALVRVQRARSLAELRAATDTVPLFAPIIVPSVLLIVAMGITMTVAGGFGWSHAWIDVVLGILVAFAVAAPMTNGRIFEALHAAVAKSGDGPVPESMNALRRSGLLAYVVFLGLMLTLAALYVMLAKPDAGEVLSVVVAAALLAALPTATLLRRASAPALLDASREAEKPITLG